MKNLILRALVLALLTIANDASAQRAAPKLEPVLCEMLGMADEYMTRHSPDGKPKGDGFVEHFYPGERKLAKRFEKLVARYGKRIGRRFILKRRKSTHFDYHCRPLARRIDALYTTVEGTFTLDPRLITTASAACRMRYIAGVHRRFGPRSNVITVANGPLKIETVAMVLRDLGCATVITAVTDTYPSGYKVFFEPTPELKTALRIKTLVTEQEFRKTQDLKILQPIERSH